MGHGTNFIDLVTGTSKKIRLLIYGINLALRKKG